MVPHIYLKSVFPLSVPSVLIKIYPKLIKYLLVWAYRQLFQTKAHPVSAQTEVYVQHS